MKKVNYRLILAITIIITSLLYAHSVRAAEMDTSGETPAAEAATAEETPAAEPIIVEDSEITEEDNEVTEEITEEGTADPQLDANDSEDVGIESITVEIDEDAASVTDHIVLIDATPTDTSSATASTTFIIEAHGDSQAAATGTLDSIIVVDSLVVQNEVAEAAAASTTLLQADVRIQIETFDGQLFDETITVTECSILPGSATTSLSAWCAVEQLATREGWTVAPAIFGDALFISAIDTYDGNDFHWWAFFHNQEFASEALNQYLLQPSDHILLSYGVFPTRLTATSLAPTIGATTTITAETFGFDSSFNAAWLPSANTTFTVNGIDTMFTDGILTLSITSNTPYAVTANVSGSFQTDTVAITPSLPQTTTQIRIETPSGTLFSAAATFSACENGSGAYTLNAKCAFDAVGIQQNWQINYSQFGSQYFLQQIDTNATDFGQNLYWLWFHNDAFASEAMNEYVVTENDELLFTYGVSPMRVSVTGTLELYSNVSLVVEEFGFDSSFNPIWSPATNATFTINNISFADDDGLYTFELTSTSAYAISIDKSGFTEVTAQITPALPTRTIHIQFETSDGTLYQNTSQSVLACPTFAGSATYSVHVGCAVEQIAQHEDWTTRVATFGQQDFLQDIDNYVTDFGQNLYWLWFHNLEFASEAINEYALQNGEHVLFSIDALPTRLTVSTTAPMVSTSIDIVAEEFGFDANFNAAWIPSTNASFTLNGIDQLSTSGTLHLDITTTTAYRIAVSKAGFIASFLTLAPTSTTTNNTPDTPCTTCSGGGSGVTPETTGRQQAVNSAIAYLISQQQNDGGFGSLLFGDWVAMAYGTHQSSDAAFVASKQALASHISALAVDTELQTLTDYERHALGLIALNQSADAYQQTILDGFDGTQFGSPTFVNDDIFAILALDELNCCATEISAAAAYIISKQNTDTGSISGVDLTAAAIRALNLIYPTDHAAILAATQYLRSQQQDDGSIGGSIIDIDATTWTLDAIGDSGETTLTSWFTEAGETPLSYILNAQGSDGSFGTQNKIWSTAYAVLALQHNWNPQTLTATNSSGGGVRTVQTDTVSTTIDITTTTDAFAPNALDTTSTTSATATSSFIQTTEPERDSSSTTEIDEEIPSAIGGVIDDVSEEFISAPNEAIEAEAEVIVKIPFETSTEEAHVVSSTNLSHPLQRAARGAAGTASAAAGSILIFLAWRFVQTLL